jgi:carbonic anhydrase/acetyltransferase-like protein (isoleucine patch superfamily)
MPSLIPVAGKAPQVAETAWLAPDVVLTGEVIVGDEATVWFGVVARGDVERIEIGSGANVQDRVVLHTDPGSPLVIGSETAVGHGAIVHGCRVGDGVLIGMGAIVLSGARIGDGALIGAGSLVLEGAEIPSRGLAVGVPARVVRLIDGDAGRRIASGYRELAARYRVEAERRNSSTS